MASDTNLSGLPRWRHRLDLVVTIVMLLASVAILVSLARGYFSRPVVNQAAAAPAVLAVPEAPLSLEGAMVLGSPRALVGIVEYSDFQCPHCGRFARDIFPGFRRDYIDAGRVLFAFRNFPLEQMHPFALKAAEAGSCAAQQGKFWAMHDALFADQARLAVDDLRIRANALGLSGPAFDTCLAAGANPVISADVASGAALHVTGTPTLFVGRLMADGTVDVKRALPGVRDEATLAATVDEVIKIADRK